MKKEKKENNLIKWTSIVLVISIILSWVLKVSLEDTNEFLRVGVMDFFTLGLLGFNLYTPLITFILVLAGFYVLLNKTEGYRKIVEKTANSMENLKDFAVFIIMLVLSLVTSILTETFVALVFVPFFVSVLVKLKYDKISTFLATFGSILIGTIGSLFGGKVVGALVTGLGIEYSTNILYRAGLLVISFIIVAAFVLLRLNTLKSKKSLEPAKDIFLEEKSNNKGSTWPVALVLILVGIITLLAYIPWGKAFGLNWATNLHEWFTSFSIAGQPVFQYIAGSTLAFGEWDLFGIQSVLLVASLIITFSSKLTFDDYINSFIEGLKKFSKLLVVFLLIYFVLTVNYYFPAIRTLFGQMMSKFNYFISAVIAFIASIFGVEMQYAWMFSGLNYATDFAGHFNDGTLAVIYQAVYGLAQFVAPTSLYLMLGLSYLDISYTEWFNKTWKFLVAILLLVIAVILLVTQL